MDKTKFIAVSTIFNGVSGYMVSQYQNGSKIAEQFIEFDELKAFCEEAEIEWRNIEIVEG